ncbi:MAG: helix-turn-helix domain-containing protein [Phycisphaerae bacterium]
MPVDSLLTVQQVAKLLNISCRQVYKLVASGRLPVPVRLGRSVRWRESDLAAFLAAGCDMSWLATSAVRA